MQVKQTWMEAVRKAVGVVNLTMAMALNRVEWKKKIHVGDSKIWYEGFVVVVNRDQFGFEFLILSMASNDKEQTVYSYELIRFILCLYLDETSYS